MMNLKSIYNNAKSSKTNADTKLYYEAIDQCIKNPVEYVLNLEYIIPSKKGIETLIPFIESNGLPICLYTNVMEEVEKKYAYASRLSAEKAKPYAEAIEFLNTYLVTHQRESEMFEYFADPETLNVTDMATLFYKEFTEDKFYDAYAKYQAAALPDLMIEAAMHGKFDEWMSVVESANLNPLELEAVSSILKNYNLPVAVTESIQKKSLSHLVNEKLSSIDKLYQESMILQTDYIVEFTETDIEHIRDLISFKEYELTCIDCENTTAMLECHNQILSLYESIAGLIDETGSIIMENGTSYEYRGHKITIPKNDIGKKDGNDNLYAYLNGKHVASAGDEKEIERIIDDQLDNGVKNESAIVEITNAQRHGNAPAYMTNNHDLSYGEDDVPNMKQNGDDLPTDKPIEATPVSYLRDEENKDSEPGKIEPEKDAVLNKSAALGGNNYYYYTYNNSLNKTDNSSGKIDHSQDHSGSPNHRTVDEIQEGFIFGKKVPTPTTQVDLKLLNSTPIDKYPDDFKDAYKLISDEFSKVAKENGVVINDWEEKEIGNEIVLYYIESYTEKFDVKKFVKESDFDDKEFYDMIINNYKEESIESYVASRLHSEVKSNLEGKIPKYISFDTQLGDGDEGFLGFYIPTGELLRFQKFITNDNVNESIDNLTENDIGNLYSNQNMKDLNEYMNSVILELYSEKMNSDEFSVLKDSDMYKFFTSNITNNLFELSGYGDEIDVTKKIDFTDKGLYESELDNPNGLGDDEKLYIKFIESVSSEEILEKTEDKYKFKHLRFDGIVFHSFYSNGKSHNSTSRSLWFVIKTNTVMVESINSLRGLNSLSEKFDVEAEFAKYAMPIKNGKEKAMNSSKWENPGAAFYDKILEEVNYPELLTESYLVAPIKDIKNSPYGRTPFSRSGCKYPHHSIRNKELVLNIAGVKAAYARAKQQGDYSGKLKEHLDKHLKELGLIETFNECGDPICTEPFSWNFNEAAEEPEKPESDHPIRDRLHDIDRGILDAETKVKKAKDDVVQTGRIFTRPTQRLVSWISSIANDWKDKNETEIKEKIADPRSRKGLYNAIRKAISIGAFAKAGLLMNPLFIAVNLYKKVSYGMNYKRIRNEMIGELKTELQIIDEKIRQADEEKDSNAKYKLMRLRGEFTKKLLRVDGGKKIAKLI